MNQETITSFINDYFKLEGNDQVLLQSFVSSCNSIKKKLSALGKNKNYNEKQNFLQQIFIPATQLKKNVQEESQENHDSVNFHDDNEICKLEVSFQALNDSVMALTTLFAQIVWETNNWGTNVCESVLEKIVGTNVCEFNIILSNCGTNVCE